jgi:hypothetical protein
MLRKAFESLQDAFSPAAMLTKPGAPALPGFAVADQPTFSQIFGA